MEKSLLEYANEIVSRVQQSGCRVVIPYAEPSPLTVMYDGSFSCAEYILSYPATLHIFGMYGHVSVCGINDIRKISSNKYVVNFGNDGQKLDMLVRIED